MSFCRQSVLAAEGDVSGLGIHGVHDGQRFQMVSQVADDAAAGLESLLDGDADPFQGGAGLGDDGDQSLQRAAVGQKIIDDQDVVVWPQKFFGDDDLIFTFVGEGFHLGHIHFPFDVDAFGFFGEDHRRMEMLGCHTGDADTGRFDGEDFVDGFAGEPFLEFGADLIEKFNVHLVVEKAVHFQYIPFLYDSVFLDSFL